MLTVLSKLQFKNTRSPIELTVLGRAAEVSEEQPINALLSMDVTLVGMVTAVRYSDPKNAPFPIVFTVLGIEYAPFFPFAYGEDIVIHILPSIFVSSFAHAIQVFICNSIKIYHLLLLYMTI